MSSMQVYLFIFDIICTKPCREYLSESDVRFMYNEMMTRSEQIYFAYVSYTMFLFYIIVEYSLLLWSLLRICCIQVVVMTIL